MTIVIDTTVRPSLNKNLTNKVCMSQITAKKEHNYATVKQVLITNNMEHFNFKNRHATWYQDIQN